MYFQYRILNIYNFITNLPRRFSIFLVCARKKKREKSPEVRGRGADRDWCPRAGKGSIYCVFSNIVAMIFTFHLISCFDITYIHNIIIYSVKMFFGGLFYKPGVLQTFCDFAAVGRTLWKTRRSHWSVFSSPSLLRGRRLWTWREKSTWTSRKIRHEA